jgi:hypothetical protein
MAPLAQSPKTLQPSIHPLALLRHHRSAPEPKELDPLTRQRPVLDKQSLGRIEEIVLKSRAFCARIPSLRRISLTSVSAATALIVAIQGVQFTYPPMAGFLGGEGSSIGYFTFLSRSTLFSFP